MTTTWHRAVKQVVSEGLKDREWAEMMGSIYADLAGGHHYDQQWVDVFFQNDPRQTLSMVDAYAFVEMWTRHNLGHIYHTRVRGSRP